MSVSAWQPTASIETLSRRAIFNARLRKFFSDRNILEVETPCLSAYAVTDIHLASLSVNTNGNIPLFLQTSPEFYMKRLLAAGSGDIYQVATVFRDDEQGQFHHREFRMLEWYRLGFDHHDLMNEMQDFMRFMLGCGPCDRCTYQQLFERHCKINPHDTNIKELQHCALQHDLQTLDLDIDGWLHYLMSHIIEPKIGINAPVFVYDFPASQAALARVRAQQYPVASRFEVYYQGIELANGFHELSDAQEQRKRFEQDNLLRKKFGLAQMPIDTDFLDALSSGLPDCAGVALGIDRLFMIASDLSHIRQAMSFC